MLHSPTWRHHGSINSTRTDFKMPVSSFNSIFPSFQGRKVQEGLRSIPPFGELPSRRVKNMKFENLVVRSQSGSDPKPKVTSKGINFPKDYIELVEQARKSAQIALKDGKTLLEVEFPTAGLDTVPDMKDMESAKTSFFDGTSFKLDYLTKPSGLEDFGFGRKVKMADRAQASDKVFVVAYPYFNVNEMIAVEELYKDSAAASNRPIIVFNGELDRIRSGYYPPFFYPKLGSIAKEFLPKFETVYYIHNFKGRSGGVLFRMYPGPWQVLRRVKDDKFVVLHEQTSMPSLKDVALNILAGA